ncbi:MAG TPA: DNA-deoxyinosine glycosylase [Lysobacter sp.]|nr:DNA-deoxyinosine glycosylase [Lysobacter sp.]
MTARLHSFPPIAPADARVLILGSMPGVRSLRENRYYAHPQNRFWPFMGRLLDIDPALPYAERCSALSAAGIALWDVLASCEREGSLDSAIRDDTAHPNDLGGLFAACPGLSTVLFNGAKAESSFRRFVAPQLTVDGRRYLRLPSTSPANASQRPADKLEAWREGLLLAGVDVLPDRP